MPKIIFIVTLLVTVTASATGQLKVLQAGTERFQTYHWPAQKASAHTVILLSGPNDHWNSDAAWWVTLAPLLKLHANVIAVERPAIGLGEQRDAQASPASSGYLAFSNQVKQVLDAYQPDGFSIIAFASSNMTVLKLLNDYPDLSPEKVLLIDPDVLTEFSVARYKKDAAPFKENLQKYTEYLSEGKYTSRVEEKNAAELEQINNLAPALNDAQSEWLRNIMDARKEIANHVNLFQEIAVYGEDLEAAKSLSWPADINLTIVDTDFEQRYINHSDDAEMIEGLQMWRKDGREYYEALTKGENRKLKVLETEEHLVMIEQPHLIADLIQP